MLNHLDERVRLPDGRDFVLGAEAERVAFHLDLGLPVWRYDLDGTVIEKRLHAPHGRNTVVVTYGSGEGAGPVLLELRPSVSFRPHGSPLEDVRRAYALSRDGDLLDVATPGLPPLRLRVEGARIIVAGEDRGSWEAVYPIEAERGYDSRGSLWRVGTIGTEIPSGGEVGLIVSTEPRDHVASLSPARSLERERERRRGLLSLSAVAGPEADALVLGADAFLVTPAGREEEGSVIAGYPWFSDWGRDTMIALEGLALVSGRHAEAARILRAFARHVRGGLIPNLFPDGSGEGVYNTADATLWFFHALDRYAAWSGDRALPAALLPVLEDIIRRHLRGTRHGIGVDPRDGLLRQGAEGEQLTWMDAKVEGLVVTPRHGKAVEINALWYNALRLMETWLREAGREEDASAMGDHAEKARRSFNRLFWHDAGGYLFDVVGDDGRGDPALRPNQIFALSLPHPILDETRWKPVLDAVGGRLLTPFGLRTLDPAHPAYKPRCEGGLRARDLAYHQGTVWAWLLGPYIDAYLRVHPDDRAGARKLLSPLVAHMNAAGVGFISEIFDAVPPFTPRGCIAQAWSVAETLRAWAKTEAT